jgi:hypothetical protein
MTARPLGGSGSLLGSHAPGSGLALSPSSLFKAGTGAAQTLHSTPPRQDMALSRTLLMPALHLLLLAPPPPPPIERAIRGPSASRCGSPAARRRPPSPAARRWSPRCAWPSTATLTTSSASATRWRRAASASMPSSISTSAAVAGSRSPSSCSTRLATRTRTFLRQKLNSLPPCLYV